VVVAPVGDVDDIGLHLAQQGGYAG